MQIFTKRPLEEQEKNNMNPDDVISCLNKYPKARIKYLEHLVLERKIEVSPTGIPKVVCRLYPIHVISNCETSQNPKKTKHNLRHSDIKPSILFVFYG